MKHRIIMLAIIPFIVYLITAFMTYDWNPGHWTEELRVFAVMLTSMVAFIVMMVHELKK